MARKNLKKAKLNNAGITLVELIIAIAILSVAIIPLLFAFVNATRYNAKGRELQQTTVLAHTIMENCKAYSKDDIDKMMLNTNDFLDFTVTGYSSKTSGNDTVYYMKGVQVENFTYDVELIMTPYGINNSADTEYELMAMESMNPYKDAVFAADRSIGYDESGNELVGSAGLDELMYITALEKVAAGIESQASLDAFFNDSPLTVSVSDLADDLSDGTGNELKLYRSIQVDVNKLDATGNKMSVTVTYEYSFALTAKKYTYVYDYVDTNGVAKTKNVEWNMPDVESVGEKVVFTIYNNTDTYTHNTGAQIENIYICYYPGYSGDSSLCPIEEDKIVLNNELDATVNIYLIKQKNAVYTDTVLTSLEAGYTPVVQGNGSTLINLYHNYNDDLSGSGGTMSVPTENGFKLPDDSLQPDPMIMEDGHTLMYKVTLAIYKTGAYDSGTNSIKSGSNPMVTLKGTSLD